jgi:outer membrane receptor protein involved in Fe transport
MQRLVKSMFIAVLTILVASSVFAQGTQTATITGSVTTPDGAPLPGVTVTAASPSMIGDRQTVTGSNGDYVLRGLIPGNYTVRFELSGMQSAMSRVNTTVGGTARADAQMRLTTAAETITVTGTAPTALETTTVGATLTNEVVETLPLARTPTNIGAMAAGVTGGDRELRTPVAGQISISGSLAYDNSILVNGVNVQDPIFGSANNLFIEGAIQETQVLTSGISAEYGHFTGGVLNLITKSGGNQFTGGLRANLTRPEWRDETPFELGFRGQGVATATPTPRRGKLGKIYEGDLGGPILRDRLWFFAAGRDQTDTAPAPLSATGINVERVITNDRYEGKLTGNITQSHTVQVSYINNPDLRTHEIQVTPFELAAIGLNSERINTGTVASYTGAISNTVFAEARWSEKKFGFRGLGGTSTNITDSPIRTATRHGALGNVVGGTYNAPYFDATDPEDRNNEQIYGALSYFLSSKNLGTHDIKGGVERFIVTRTGGNSQSATSRVYNAAYISAPGGTAPILTNGRIQPRWIPFPTPGAPPAGSGPGFTNMSIFVATRGAVLDLTTDSIYLQDRWDVSPRWTVQAGVRYEQAKGEATGDIQPIDTTSTVPRLGVSFDPLADGRFRFDATYAQYAGRYNPSVAGRNTPVGNPAQVLGRYVGPAGEGLNFAPGFDLNNYVFYAASVPTANQFIEDGLRSPINHEWTASAGMAFGTSGWVKATYVDRKLKGVIEDFITGGCTNITLQNVNVGCVDNALFSNTDGAFREYQAAQIQARYGFTRNWQVEGNYTRQFRNHGNYEGEGGQAIGATIIGDRPETLSEREFPVGRLPNFQEDKLRLWTTYRFSLGPLGNLSSGLIYRYDSGQVFSYSTTVNRPATLLNRNPGCPNACTYRNPSPTATIFFGERGAGEYDATNVFDVSLTWALPIARVVEPWIKGEVRNALNDQALIAHNIGITANTTGPLDSDGLPSTFTNGAAFGRPTGATSYVVPREYLVSAGIRF